jgi:hypothetical protein
VIVDFMPWLRLSIVFLLARVNALRDVSLTLFHLTSSRKRLAIRELSRPLGGKGG